jgi:hypothetical protein
MPGRFSMRHLGGLSLAIAAVIAVAVCACGQGLAAGRTVIFAYTEEDRDTPMIHFYTAKYTEAFKRLGMGFAVAYFPRVRCSVMANAGEEVDGEPGRVFEYSQTYANMIRVPEPSNALNFTAYSADPSIGLSSWDDLGGDRYNVLFVSGMVHVSANLSPRVAPSHLSHVPAIGQALRMLAAGRADVFIAPREFVLPLIKAGGADFAKIREVKVLGEMPVYAHLHKKNADLVPKLEEVLRQINAEGKMRVFDAAEAMN